MKMHVSTHKGLIFSDEVSHFVIKNDEGEFAVLKGHIPVVSVIPSGYVKIVLNDNSEKFYCLVNALLEFKDNNANILAHEAIFGETKEEAKENLDKIRESRIEDNKKVQADYTRLENDLKKSIRESKAGNI